MKARLLIALVTVAACLFSLATSAAARQKVALELVLALDTSTSIDEAEYNLQRFGLARAFRHPRVIRAIKSLGPQGMAASVIQWAGTGQQAQAVSWNFINGRQSAQAFASHIEKMPRSFGGFTNIAAAIRYSSASLESNLFDGRRLVIDISGDGTSDENDPALARDRAVQRGVTINALIIHSFEYDLGDLARIHLQTHYRDQVIGGQGAFLLNAEGFETFERAMREKLVREITGPVFATR